MADYWRKQQPGQPLYGDILWSRPERRDQAGRLTVIGGNSHGFSAVASAYQLARQLGVGEVRAVIPDALGAKLPTAVRHQLDDLILAPSNPSGGLALGAERDLAVAAGWSNNLLFIGDNGANAETAKLLERFLTNQAHQETRVTLARDTIDLLVYSAEALLARENCHLVLSLAQLQKLARAVYYPRVITFLQGVKQIAETLHKFTISYRVVITLFHDDNLLVAGGGEVVSQSFTQPMRVWSGEIATREAAWSVWQPDIIKATATSWTEL